MILGYLLVSVKRLPEGRSALLSHLQEAVDRGHRGLVDAALRWGLVLVAAELHEWATLSSPRRS